MGRAEYKVPDGKLLAAESEVTEKILLKIKITGDFFMHPETSIEELEERLTGINLEEIENVVEDFFKNSKIMLYGASPKDFSHVVNLSIDTY